MANSVPPLENLIEHFARLNGIGRKSAVRLAYQVLSMDGEQAASFAAAIVDAHEKIRRCNVCKNLTVDEVCAICRDTARDQSTICVVESSRDITAFENRREYVGLYHVLGGLLSPGDGVGPGQIYVKELMDRLQGGAVREVIMATNSTLEGEATAAYLAELIRPLGILTTRLAAGLPVGGNLEYVDEVTLFRALSGRGQM